MSETKPLTLEEIQKQSDNDKIKFENEGDFSLFVIEPNHIADRDWMSPSYLPDLVNDTFCSIHKTNPKKFIESVGTLLKVNDYEYPDVRTTVIHEEPGYMYEIMYINTTPKYHKVENENEFALLLQNNGNEKIYGSMILLKSHLPIDNMNSATLCEITRDDVIMMLFDRANTKVVLYDEEFREERVLGPMELYADMFLQTDNIQKIEFPFLKYNLNIWYVEDKDYGDDAIKNLLDVKIERCIIFTLINDDYRGNLTLEEFNKILYLAGKLDNYSLQPKYNDEEKDELGRNIIKNKYRILEQIYKSNL